MPRPKKNTFKHRTINRAGGTEYYANTQGVPKGKKYKQKVSEEESTASELLNKRATAEFSSKELGALMQVPPGGAEPRQIAPTRQFRGVTRDLPEMVVTEPIYETGAFRLPVLNEDEKDSNK
jgi:hypothetical protein